MASRRIALTIAAPVSAHALAPMLALVAALAVSGCAAGPTVAPSSPAPLAISNGTSITVTLVVNGAVVETVPPGGYQDPVTASLPPLPWSVEARSPSGRVLSRLSVSAGDVVYTTPDASGHSSAQGRATRVDLSCGRLDVWSGPPMLGPSVAPGGSPGDCD